MEGQTGPPGAQSSQRKCFCEYLLPSASSPTRRGEITSTCPCRFSRPAHMPPQTHTHPNAHTTTTFVCKHGDQGLLHAIEMMASICVYLTREFRLMPHPPQPPSATSVWGAQQEGGGPCCGSTNKLPRPSNAHFVVRDG